MHALTCQILKSKQPVDLQPIMHSIKPFTHLCLHSLDLILQAADHSVELRYFPLGASQLIAILVRFSSHLVKLVPADIKQKNMRDK